MEEKKGVEIELDVIARGNVYGYIYLITNLINGKQYVGLTTRTPKIRFEEHCDADSYIGRAIRKYGRQNFTIEEIDYAYSLEELNELEIDYIYQYNTFENGYNQTVGGNFTPSTIILDINLNENQKIWKRRAKEIGDELHSDFSNLINDRDFFHLFLLYQIIDIYLSCRKLSDKKYATKVINKWYSKGNVIPTLIENKILEDDFYTY